MMIGREDTMIAGEMTARWRDERREAMQEIERRERELGPPVAQRTLDGETTRPDGSSESRVLASEDLAP
jgi:hypothetical protein